MDDGHPAGWVDLAGDEELLLTPVPEPALSKAEVSGSERLRIFNAWSDEPWVNDGAAVRVSLVCFGAEGRSAAHSAKPGVSLVLSGGEGPARIPGPAVMEPPGRPGGWAPTKPPSTASRWRSSTRI